MADYDIKVVLTKNKKIKPDETKLSFGKYFTDHMFVMDYANGQGWVEPKIVPNEPIAVDPAAMVFHYGQAVFEGMKAYRGDDGKIRLFRPTANFARLNRSDERMCIPHIDEDLALYALKELIKVDEDWVPSAPNTSLYIRPFVIATEAALGVHPAMNYKFMIILSPVGPYYPTGLAPVDILVEDEYVRAVRGGIGFAKASANYAVSLKGQQKAIEKGYAQVLWLDGIERKYLEEVGTMNVFLVINDELITPELNGSILPGITRDSVITLGKSWGMNVVERKISLEEVRNASKDGSLKEAFGAGTAAVISPIKNFIEGEEVIPVGNGTTGPIAQKFYDNLTGMQYGRIKDTMNWVVEI
jgi:branched-chain amino acid aminotransferase